VGKQYTVKDSKSGKTVTFEWNGGSPPNQADMARVFATAGLGDDTPPPAPEASFEKNLVESGVKFGSDVVDAVSHPVETAKGIGSLLINVFKANSPDPMDKLEGQTALAPIFDLYEKRYGGWENIKNTAYKDPVGFMADLSTVLGAGGGALRASGKAAGIKGVETAGRAMGVAGGMIDPIAAIPQAGKAIVGMTGAPERMMGKALKLPSSTPMDLAKQVKATALETKATVGSYRTYEKMQTRMSELRDLVDQKIQAGTGAGLTMDADEIVGGLGDLRARVKNSIAPQADLKALDRLEEQFRQAHGKTITVGQAQEIKKRTYRELDKFYDQVNVAQSPIVKEGKAAMARSIKDKIAELVPDVAKLNKEESDLLRLEPFIERSINMKESKNILGVHIPVWYMASQGSGSGVNAGKAGVILTAQKIIDSPYFKSKMAIALDKARKRLGNQSKVIKPLGQFQRTQPEQTE
jgi:hypothetical protein